MLELCVTSTFWVPFSWFLTGKLRQRFLKHGIGIECDARGTAAKSHAILMVLTPPPVEASGGHKQYYVRSAWHLQSCIRLAWHYADADIPPVEPSSGQEQYYVMPVWHLWGCRWPSWLEHYCVHQAIGILQNWPIHGNSSLCSSTENTSVHSDHQTYTPGHSKPINTRQVIQITNSALYKHLALLSATVYSCVSTSPHHIFFHQMYGNTVRTISTLDQFTHILPQAVNCITTPRYYFQGITFISYWIVNTTIEEADYSQAYLPQMWGSQTYPPKRHQVVKNGNFTFSTVRVHIGTSTGRSTLPLHQVADQLAWKSAHVAFWVCQSQCTMLELSVTSTLWVTMVFSWLLTGRF